MPDIYITIADSSRARILYASGKVEPFEEITELTHPEGRVHARDLTSDLPGHGSNHVGSGKHKMDSSSNPRQIEQEHFAREISNYLERLHKEKHIDQLMIAAPPAFLGLLRSHFSVSIKQLIRQELDKNLTQHNAETLRDFLPYFKPIERVIS